MKSALEIELDRAIDLWWIGYAVVAAIFVAIAGSAM